MTDSIAREMTPASPAAEDRFDSSAGQAVSLDSLLRDIVAGDANAETAVQQFHDLTVGRLMGLARGMLRNAADAEEAVCDTYVQVWQTARQFDEQRASPIAWLIMICRSRCLDRLRSRKLQTRLVAAAASEPVNATDEGPERLLSMLQSSSRVRSALEALPSDKRRLIELAFLEGLSHAELSARLRLPLGTVKSHLRRSLQALHASIEGIR